MSVGIAYGLQGAHGAFISLHKHECSSPLLFLSFLQFLCAVCLLRSKLTSCGVFLLQGAGQQGAGQQEHRTFRMSQAAEEATAYVAAH
eukprot:13901-Heterococcus_DN1.PRE.1